LKMEKRCVQPVWVVHMYPLRVAERSIPPPHPEACFCVIFATSHALRSLISWHTRLISTAEKSYHSLSSGTSPDPHAAYLSRSQQMAQALLLRVEVAISSIVLEFVADPNHHLDESCLAVKEVRASAHWCPCEVAQGTGVEPRPNTHLACLSVLRGIGEPAQQRLEGGVGRPGRRHAGAPVVRRDPHPSLSYIQLVLIGVGGCTSGLSCARRAFTGAWRSAGGWKTQCTRLSGPACPPSVWATGGAGRACCCRPALTSTSSPPSWSPSPPVGTCSSSLTRSSPWRPCANRRSVIRHHPESDVGPHVTHPTRLPYRLGRGSWRRRRH
jgi:hypothetical protein